MINQLSTITFLLTEIKLNLSRLLLLVRDFEPLQEEEGQEQQGRKAACVEREGQERQ